MTGPMNIFPGNSALPVQPVHFPQNIIKLLSDRFVLADPTIDVLLRPIRTVDRDFTRLVMTFLVHQRWEDTM
jgi:hypothetical protein